VILLAHLIVILFYGFVELAHKKWDATGFVVTFIFVTLCADVWEVTLGRTEH
jgi:hypothetical protein